MKSGSVVWDSVTSSSLREGGLVEVERRVVDVRRGGGGLGGADMGLRKGEKP